MAAQDIHTDEFIRAENAAAEFHSADPDDAGSFPTLVVADARVALGVERAQDGRLRFRIVVDMEDVYAFMADNGNAFIGADGNVHYVIEEFGGTVIVRDNI